MSKISKKIAKKQNALKHGVYSQEVMLPGEKWSDYEALRAAHYDEFMPEGVIEECLVDELFMLRWKKRRMDQYDQILLRRRAAQLHCKNDINRHRKNLKSFAAEFSNATSVEAVEQILYLLSPLYISVITSRVPREKFEDPTEWGPAIGKFLLDFKPIGEALQQNKPGKKEDIGDWFYLPSWKKSIPLTQKFEPEWDTQNTWVIFNNDDEIGKKLINHLN